MGNISLLYIVLSSIGYMAPVAWKLYSRYVRPPRTPEEIKARFRSDLRWIIGYTVIFGTLGLTLLLFSPDTLFGARTERAAGPVSVAGVEFPAGSEVTYHRTTLITRTPSAVSTPTPVAFGALRIAGLELAQDSWRGPIASIRLADDQRIDGWACDTGTDIALWLKNRHWVLYRCRLNEPTTVDGIAWTAQTTTIQRTLVNSQEGIVDQGLALSSRFECTSPLAATALPISWLEVDYDDNLRTTAWNATLCNYSGSARTRIGRYESSSADDPVMTLLPDRRIRIVGSFQDTEQASPAWIGCLLLNARGEAPEICPADISEGDAAKVRSRRDRP